MDRALGDSGSKGGGRNWLDRGGGEDDRKCHTCGKSGHIRRDCPQGDGGGGGGRDRPDDRECHTCGKTGHIRRDCPQGDRGGSDRSDDRAWCEADCYFMQQQQPPAAAFLLLF